MNQTKIDEFVARHRTSTDPHVAELVQQVKAGFVHLSKYSPDASSKELASTYNFRAKMAKTSGRDSVAVQMQTLADRCRDNETNTCSIWFFTGAEISYAVFELQPSNSIAACVKVAGSSTEFRNEA